MGNAIARNGDSITQGIIYDHITVRYWDSEYGYTYDTINTRVNGNVKNTTNSVYVNGIRACTRGDLTTETDSYDIPYGWSYYSGEHNNASGSVNNGSSTVFIGGKPVARKGDSVTLHNGSSTTSINSGSSNVFVG